MPRKKITWMVGNREFPTKKEAEEAEEQIKITEKIEENMSLFEKYFKTYYNEVDKYNSYTYLCADCGKKLFEYERIWDGHRTERGDSISHAPHFKFLGGWRCLSCHSKKIELFDRMRLNYKEKTGNYIFLDHNDMYDFYRLNLDIKLHIILMMLEWEKVTSKNKT